MSDENEVTPEDMIPPEDLDVSALAWIEATFSDESADKTVYLHEIAERFWAFWYSDDEVIAEEVKVPPGVDPISVFRDRYWVCSSRDKELFGLEAVHSSWGESL